MIELKTVSSLEKVFGGGIACEEEKRGSMLANERYNFQLCIFNDGSSVRDVSLSVEGIDSEYLTVRQVVEIPGARVYNEYDDYVIFDDDNIHMFPDLLRPVQTDALFLRARQWTALWCTVHAKDGLKAGEHKLKFTVVCGEQTVSTEYVLDVVGARLPESDLIYTDWMHYDAIANYYHTEPFSERFYELLGTFIDSAVAHGMNMLYTPLFTPPLDTKIGGERLTVQLIDVKKSDKGYKFGFNKLEKFIDFALLHGIKYFEMSHLTTQWGAKACPKIMTKTDEGTVRIFGWDTSSSGDEYKAFLKAFLPALDKFLKKKCVADKCYFHISDEPAAAHYAQFREVFDFIRPLIKDYKVMDATEDTALVDCPVISLHHITDDLPEKCWVYYCCTAYKNYVPNRFFNMPSQRNRILGFLLYLSGAKGFLQWGFNFYNSQYSTRPLDPFLESDAGGAFPSGDSYIVYPGTGGAWDSLRHEVFYDGLQDRMALKALEKKIGRDKVIELLKAEGLDGYRVYPRSDKWHLEFRRKINEMLK